MTGDYTMEKAPLYHLDGDIDDKALADLKAKEGATTEGATEGA